MRSVINFWWFVWLLPDTWSHLSFAGVRECPPWCSIVGTTVTVHKSFCILHFCHTCALCRVEMVEQFPARGSTQVLLCLFLGLLWLWHFLYGIGPHPVSSLHIYTFVVLRAFMAGAASQAGDADSSRAPGLIWFAGVHGCPPWCSIVGSTVTVHQFFCILHFCLTCSLCCEELIVQFPARGSTQVLLCLFPGVLWLWHFLFIIGPHPVPSIHKYTFVVSRAFMAGAASKAGDADSSRAPGLTSGRSDIFSINAA